MFINYITLLIQNNRTAACTKPHVDMQPQIFMPKYNPLLKMKDHAELSLCLTGFNRPERLFALEFSINHCLPIRDYTSIDEQFLKFQTPKIILRKYRKKTIDTIDALDLQRPRIVLHLDFFDTSCEDFNLYISNSSYREDLYKLNKGCQLISIYTETKKNERRTVANVLKAIEGFRRLMEISHPDDALNYAFKFFIELPVLKTTCSEKTKEQFLSCMFKYVFDENGYSVRTEEVSPEDYWK